MLDPLTAEEMQLRKAFVQEYIKDYDAALALVRMGQPFELAQRMAQHYVQDCWVQTLLQKEKEQFFTKLSNRDETVMGIVASRYYEEACTARGSAKLAALGKLSDLLKMETARSTRTDNPSGLSLDEIQQELIRRGLPSDILEDQFSPDA
jgi:argininosuccinate lyase